MDPSRTGSESGRPKPKLFSMSQSRALLESRRLNGPSANYSQYSSNVEQDRGPPQNPPRVSLTSFLAHPARISTPTPPRNTYGTSIEQVNENSKISDFRCLYAVFHHGNYFRWIVSPFQVLCISRTRIYSYNSVAFGSFKIPTSFSASFPNSR